MAGDPVEHILRLRAYGSEQREHQEAFIRECRHKALGAAYHTEWISKRFDSLVTEYGKLKVEDRTFQGEIKKLEIALDYHTVENRNKRKALQERRNAIAKTMVRFA